MYGFLEVITLLLALSGSGIDKNSSPPKGAALLSYAVEDADVAVHLDATAVLPRNVEVLLKLPQDPAIKASPELLKIAKEAKSNIEGVRSMAKAMLGFDPVTDISSVTVFIKFDDKSGDPAPLAVVRGTFPAGMLKKVAKLVGSSTGSIDGRDTMTFEGMLVGTAKDGTMIAGRPDWVEARLDDDWKPIKPKKGSAWATISKQLDKGPFFLVASKPAKALRAIATKELGSNFAGALVAGHELAVLALHHDGLALHWKASDKGVLEQVALATDGLMEMMRAAHVAPRGAAKIVVAALRSYAGQDKAIDALIARQDDILKLVTEYTGDGKFDVDTKKDKKALTLDVRASGKKLSDVLPVSVLLPAVAAGVFLGVSKDAEMAAPPPPKKPARKPVPPRKGGGLGDTPKKQ